MAESLRVLMTADAVGGVWTYALELARALQPFDVQLVLVTFGPSPRPHQLAAAAHIENLTVMTRELALEWMPEPWSDVDSAGEWLLELEHQLNPDIVHINGYAHAALDFRAPVVAVAHSCVCSWWRAVHDCDAPQEWDEYRQRVAAGLRAADIVVAPSAAMLAELSACHGAPKRSRVIHNGRAIEPISRGKQALVLSVGRMWDAAKNLALLDRSAAGLDWPVYVVGSAPRQTATTAARMLGPRREQQVLDWMARAAIYCLPARYEPFGLSVLEAAQAGCALVLGDIASLRELWGDAAVYVPPNLPPNRESALTDALRELMEDGDRRVELAARASARAANYRPERMAARYRTLYDELRVGYGGCLP